MYNCFFLLYWALLLKHLINLSLIQNHKDFILTFTCQSFMILAITFGSVSYLSEFYKWYQVWIEVCFCIWIFNFSIIICWNQCLLSTYCFTPSPNQLYLCMSFLGFFSIPLIMLSWLSPQTFFFFSKAVLVFVRVAA